MPGSSADVVFKLFALPAATLFTSGCSPPPRNLTAESLKYLKKLSGVASSLVRGDG